MKKALLVLLTVVISFMTAAQTPSLSPQMISDFKTLVKQGTIQYYPESAQIVRINPDVWRSWNFTERKGFTDNLCIYVNRYVRGNLKVEDWWVQIEDMATHKKLARLSQLGGYKEF
jgi:hypothetical protein